MRLEPADLHSPLVVPEDGWGLGRGYQLLEQSRRFLALREWCAFDARADISFGLGEEELLIDKSFDQRAKGPEIWEWMLCPIVLLEKRHERTRTGAISCLDKEGRSKTGLCRFRIDPIASVGST